MLLIVIFMRRLFSVDVYQGSSEDVWTSPGESGEEIHATDTGGTVISPLTDDCTPRC